MPNWKVHLEVAKRLNDVLKYKDKEYNEFLIGNILPDINNCYVVKDISSRISHKTTHFSPLDKGRDFYKKYSKYFDNPVVLGYYTHLCTDYFWNSDFYSKYVNSDNLSDDDVRILKQRDFKIFNNNFAYNTIRIYDYDELLKNISIISEVSVTEMDIKNVIAFLDKFIKYDEGEYAFYNNSKLETLLDYTVNSLSEDIKKWPM